MSDEWLHNQIEIARYVHAPVGNLPPDHHAFTCDLFFARQLRRQNHVLWASPSTRPDLGGKEDDDNRLMTDMHDHDTLTINNPGVYEKACVDIALNSLPVTAVMQSALINDKEGAGGVVGSFDTTQHSLDDMMGRHLASAVTPFDESAQCMPAFRVLKSMVGTWLQEVVRHGDARADEQLEHFYRWLKSPAGLLFDPALLRMVRGMMKKLFLQLVGELKSLGSTPIYASFNRLLLRTEKTSARDAREYTAYILDVVRRKELFSILHLAPTTVWEHLVWMDPANYGGVDESALLGLQKRHGDSASVQNTPRSPKRVAMSTAMGNVSASSKGSSSSRRTVVPMAALDDEEEEEKDHEQNRVGAVQGSRPQRRTHALEDSDDEDERVATRQHPTARPRAHSPGALSDASDALSDDRRAGGEELLDSEDVSEDGSAAGDGRVRVRRRRRKAASSAGWDDMTVTSTPAGTATTASQAPEFEILMHWNIQGFLPQTMCQEQFERIVAKWILLTYGARRAERETRGGVGQTPVKNRGMAQGASQATQRPRQDDIRRDLTDLLMRSVSGIHALMPGDAGAVEQSDDFPRLAGSHLKLTSPALEFVKFVTHVLLLDSKTASDTARLKRDLLRIINVREFAPEAKFQDPCDTFVLSEVICTFCNVYVWVERGGRGRERTLEVNANGSQEERT